MTYERAQRSMDAGPAAVIRATLRQMEPVSLDTVTATADLQTRVDRKYLLPPEVFVTLADELRDHALALDIDGSRAFAYESVYFDTPERTSYRAAAHDRRRRFKVRTRTYTDSNACVLEVKTVGGRGQTIKVRQPHDPRRRDALDGAALAFIDAVLGTDEVSRTLRPTLTTAYDRSTLLGMDLDFRLTADTGLVCSAPNGMSIPMTDHVLVETKSRSAPTRPDRVLWALGQRPVRISKFCVGLAALDPTLPANRWHRTLHQHLQLR